MKITPTTLQISQLLGSDNEQYVIPAYQRRYSWRWGQIADLWDDINVLENSETHLLGTIVCLSSSHNAVLNQLELVDGQQRLTSISILLHRVLARLKMENQTKQALKLEGMLYGESKTGGAVPKIQLESLDAAEYAAHAAGEDVQNPTNKHLANAFESFTDFLNDMDLDEVLEFLKKLLGQALIIRLDVSEAKDAFKLFETINSRGLRLSPADNIKNYLLGNAARFGDSELEFARQRWSEITAHLDGGLVENFFRQYLTQLHHKPITKTRVVESFKEAFRNMVEEAKSLPETRYFEGVDDEEDDTEDEEKLAVASETDEDDEDADAGEWEILSFRDFLIRIEQHARCYREICFSCTGKAKLNRAS